MVAVEEGRRRALLDAAELQHVEEEQLLEDRGPVRLVLEQARAEDRVAAQQHRVQRPRARMRAGLRRVERRQRDVAGRHHAVVVDAQPGRVAAVQRARLDQRHLLGELRRVPQVVVVEVRDVVRLHRLPLVGDLLPDPAGAEVRVLRVPDDVGAVRLDERARLGRDVLVGGDRHLEVAEGLAGEAVERRAQVAQHGRAGRADADRHHDVDARRGRGIEGRAARTSARGESPGKSTASTLVVRFTSLGSKSRSGVSARPASTASTRRAPSSRSAPGRRLRARASRPPRARISSR